MTMTTVYWLFGICAVLFILEDSGVFEQIAQKIHRRKIDKAINGK